MRVAGRHYANFDAYLKRQSNSFGMQIGGSGMANKENLDAFGLLAAKLDKYVSRETAALILGAYGLFANNATPEIWTLFSLTSVAIFRGIKAYETVATASQVLSSKQTETTSVVSVKDNQDKPKTKPSFDPTED
jgi:hypothetical protein